MLSLFESREEQGRVAEYSPQGVVADGVLLSQTSLSFIANAFNGVVRGRPLASAVYYSRAFEDLIKRTLSRNKFDIVQIEHSLLAPYICALPASYTGRAILDLHNLGVSQYRSMMVIQTGWRRALAGIKVRLMSGWEVRWANRFDRVTTVSELEHDELLRLGVSAQRLAVVPNGVSCSRIKMLPRPCPKKPNLLFVGPMGYLPNRDAVNYFCDDIMPLVLARVPGCRLRVVGGGASKLHSRHSVDFLGRLDDLRGEYSDASVVVVPLRAGGGTRLKILEAAALGRPVVSTIIGAEGLHLEHERHLLIAPTAKAFAEQVVSLLTDPERGNSLAVHARERVERAHNWDKIGDEYASLLTELGGMTR